MKFKLKSGQVLVELLLALVVSSLALVAMTQVATKSVSNSGYSRNRSEANKYAVEAVEWIRSQRTDWSTFSSYNGTYCMDDLNLTICPSNDIVPGTVFSRRAVFNKPDPNKLTVDVTVTWDEKGRTTSSKQSIIFQNY